MTTDLVKIYPNEIKIKIPQIKIKNKEIKIPGPYSGHFNPVTILYTKIQNNTILVMRLVLDKLINFTDINIITWQQHYNSQQKIENPNKFKNQESPPKQKTFTLMISICTKKFTFQRKLKLHN